MPTNRFGGKVKKGSLKSLKEERAELKSPPAFQKFLIRGAKRVKRPCKTPRSIKN